MSKSVTLTMSVFALACIYSLPGFTAPTFYYDPDSGNVSFDTSQIQSGGLYSYILGLDYQQTSIRFRGDEHVLAFESAFVQSGVNLDASAGGYHLLGEWSFSERVEGYFTIGDVLPPGLSQSTWDSLFDFHLSGLEQPESRGLVRYTDIIGGPSQQPVPRFVYGQPNRPFDNRWDLADPDLLDWAEAASLLYDPLTGHVTLDTSRGEQGGHISFFILESDNAFLSDNFRPWLNVPFAGASPGLIGLAADAIEPGVYGIGRILPAGLSLGEVQAVITSARFVGRTGFGGSNFDIDQDSIDFAFLVVPEPTAAATIQVGFLLALVRRRRRVPLACRQ